LSAAQAAAAKSLGVHEPQVRWFEPCEEGEADRYLAADCEQTGCVRPLSRPGVIWLRIGLDGEELARTIPRSSTCSSGPRGG
jgi:hypothetical protein